MVFMCSCMSNKGIKEILKFQQFSLDTLCRTYNSTKEFNLCTEANKINAQSDYLMVFIGTYEHLRFKILNQMSFGRNVVDERVRCLMKNQKD
jgi:hypothetical protein